MERQRGRARGADPRWPTYAMVGATYRRPDLDWGTPADAYDLARRSA